MRSRIRALLYAATLIIFSWSFSPTANAILDSESMDCLSCHDAGLAGDITLDFCPLPECDHPIGLDYRMASSSNHGLVPESRLNPAIILPGGTVSCVSCHIRFDDNHTAMAAARAIAQATVPPGPDPMLVMDNRVSQLCLACHIK